MKFISILNQLSVICLILIPLLQCQQNPTISFISKERVVSIGDTLDMLCQVQYAKDYPVVWTKVNKDNPNNHLFISRGSTIIIPENRYSVNYNEREQIYTLVISKVQEIDAGEYRCEITTGISSKVTADVQVFIQIPPVISDNSTRSVITYVGANVTLQCYATGYPPPKISWRREQNELLPNGMAYYMGTKLNLGNITKDHRGTYYCVADNGVSSGARRHIGVEVEFPPYVSIARPQTGQALQYDADLHCHIEAFPSPSVIWLKDGQILNDNQHYQISIFARSDEFTDTTLRVKRIEKRQYGYYMCRAVNKLGFIEKEIELVETVNVVCPPACNVGLQFTSGAIQVLTSQLNFIAVLLSIVLSIKFIRFT
ncbi:lachesin-like [Oppia nitens]|uniref:lachesin-like n=1 Tax=Oppia nitens TaxID=1686743 RepID=UPI0023DB9F0F|nr:lachesin-like [Oppia nitens]